MIKKELRYSYNDVSIIPAKVSGIEHRSDCCPYIYNYNGVDFLPLITAPMTSVVGMDNYEKYLGNGIIPILPRGTSLDDRLGTHQVWSAYSLAEVESVFLASKLNSAVDFCSWSFNILIDIANGHMQKLYDVVSRLKKKRGPSVRIMVGNIANPETYEVCEAAGVDYVRVGIGSGRGCITSSNVSVHYPMASLIEETYMVKERIHGKCKIVADGGIRNYSDVIKALALGADYVMIGSVFAKMLESSAPICDVSGNILRASDISYLGGGRFTDASGNQVNPRKQFYGMASALGQIDIDGKKTKTAEGIDMYLPVEYTMESWVNNFRDYLRSAMSYTGAHTLADFIGKPELAVISENTYQSVNK